MVEIVLPRTTGGAGPSVTFPRAEDYAEIPVSVVGAVAPGLLARPIITKPINSLTGQATGSGSGTVTFTSPSGLVATATFPSGAITLTGLPLSGTVSIEATGSLSDISITLGGLR